LSNICRGKEKPSFKEVYKTLPFFVNALKNETNVDVIIDASWALSYLTEGDNE